MASVYLTKNGFEGEVDCGPSPSVFSNPKSKWSHELMWPAARFISHKPSGSGRLSVGQVNKEGYEELTLVDLQESGGELASENGLRQVPEILLQ